MTARDPLSEQQAHVGANQLENLKLIFHRRDTLAGVAPFDPLPDGCFESAAVALTWDGSGQRRADEQNGAWTSRLYCRARLNRCRAAQEVQLHAHATEEI
jgi:hypothetical protein